MEGRPKGAALFFVRQKVLWLSGVSDDLSLTGVFACLACSLFM